MSRNPIRKPVARALLPCALLVASLLSCDSFSFFEALDGKGGIGLEISPLAATLPVNETVTFTIKGGFPPYDPSAAVGTLSEHPADPSRWTYTAPNLTGLDTVSVTDSRGNRRQAEVSVIPLGAGHHQTAADQRPRRSVCR